MTSVNNVKKLLNLLEIPIEILTNKPDIVLKEIFDDNQNRDIILDRARIKFLKETRVIESPQVKIELMIITLTPFGAASVANFIFDRLGDIGYTKIKIGDKVQRISKDKIREAILKHYPK